MAYEPSTWADGEAGGTPVTATALNKIENGIADADHQHDASDIASGTFAAARIPTLAQSKVTGLQAALDGKQDSGDYATTAALAALEARVAALEPEA